MWEGIESTVLDKVINLELTEEQKQEALEGAEYETALTRALQRRAGGGSKRQAANKAQLDKLQQAARRAMAQLEQSASPEGQAEQVKKAAAAAAKKSAAAVPKVRPNDPCPCGSGKRYKKCHGKRKTA